MPIDLFFYGLALVLLGVPLLIVYLTVKLLVAAICVIVFHIRKKKQNKSREQDTQKEGGEEHEK